MGIEGYYEDYFDDRQEKEKLTNFQKIKNMSLDEMAEFMFCHFACARCLVYAECAGGECKIILKQWLQEESD